MQTLNDNEHNVFLVGLKIIIESRKLGAFDR